MELNPSLLPLETLAWTAISAWALVEWSRPLLDMFEISGPQRALALRSMALVVGAVVGAILHPEVTEDEVFNAGSFLNAHAYCTAARVYEMVNQLDNANLMRQRCQELMDISLRSLALDRDGDNVVDDNELDVAKKGGSARDLRASWSSYNKTAYDATFTPTRGMRH